MFGVDRDHSTQTGQISVNTRRGLIALQLALCVVLSVGAGLAFRTVLHLEQIDPGFQTRGLLTARIYILEGSHQKFFTQLLERIRPLPGVQSVALASTIPLRAAVDPPRPMRIRGRKTMEHNEIKFNPPFVRIVSPEYFRTIGARVLSGRDLSEQDSDHAHPVVLVNKHLADRYWPNESAVGKEISLSDNQWLPIVGVVSDVRDFGLDREPADEVYGSFAEEPQRVMSVVIRCSQVNAELAEELKWISHDIDPQAVLAEVRPMVDLRSEWLAPRRTTAIFLSVFAVVALCITTFGISGMMALTVGERKHEIGVKLAVGATPGVVIAAMMKQMLVLVTIGLGAGFCAAWMMSRLMSYIIFGISPRDITTYAISSALLFTAAMASAFIPLTRITKIDPVLLLKAE